MPTAATASKTATRKTRTRKATPKVSTKIPTVTTTSFRGGKVVNKQIEISKPDAVLLPISVYRKDISNRWNVHHYEMQELVKDIRKGLKLVSPYYAQLVKQVKAWTV
jgi:hypothetical protein